MINPHVSYHLPNNKSNSGVAINLKGFVELLDKYQIPHASERALRGSLGDQCLKSNGKQHFLAKNEIGVKTMISRTSSECRVCVCIPASQVPQEFSDFFAQGRSTTLCVCMHGIHIHSTLCMHGNCTLYYF